MTKNQRARPLAPGDTIKTEYKVQFGNGIGGMIMKFATWVFMIIVYPIILLGMGLVSYALLIFGPMFRLVGVNVPDYGIEFKLKAPENQ